MDLAALGRAATALHREGRLDEAEPLYRQILAANPNVFPALFFLGMLRLQKGDSAEAAQVLARALALNPADPAARMQYGLALQGQMRFAEARDAFELVLAAHPGHPAARMGRGAALRALGETQAALADHEAVLAADPGNADVWNGRGALLRNLKRVDEALESFDRAIALAPDFAEALQNRGDLHWSDRVDYRAALADLERAHALAPDRPWLLGNLLHLKMFGADWRGHDAQVAQLRDAVHAGARAVHPFIYQAIAEDPADLQRCSRIYTNSLALPAPLPPRPARGDGRIRLGYVSGELRVHAVSQLMAGLFECHDRARFEVVAIDHGGGDNSAMRARLERAFDRFLPITGLSDRQAAERIAAGGIDILVNLNGYFGTPRTGVFALRPAPVQVSYMGFPATMGAPFMDYVLADRIVVPDGEERFYDEKVVRLPDTYWVNDRARALPGPAPARTDCGLSESAFVFCNFNNTYKLTPATFDVWMEILKQAPGSMLWLWQGNNPVFADHARREAAARGVDPARLAFAGLVTPEQNLARLQLADLVLDSLPYNAHTTASDALWAGVPVLTLRGTTWPGRVGASLLGAMDLPELVTETAPDFIARAVALARDPSALAALKRKLAQNRLATPLFDTERFARHMEAAYIRMMERARAGAPPEGFSV